MVPGPVAWEYEDDYGHWAAMSPDLVAKVERMAKANYKEFEVISDSGDAVYDIDLNELTQVRVWGASKYGACRRIRRIIILLGPDTNSAAAASAASTGASAEARCCPTRFLRCCQSRAKCSRAKRD